MSDKKKKIQDSAEISSRFERKSQGVRTQSQNAKKAAQARALEEEQALEEAILAAEKEAEQAMLTKIAQTFTEEASASASGGKKTAGRASEEDDKTFDTAQLKGKISASSSGKSSGAKTAKKTYTSDPSSYAESMSNFDAAMKLAETEDTVILKKSDIPIYEIGLGSEEYYLPPEIKSGKVRKITEDEFARIKAAGPVRKMTRREKKKAQKVKKTPLQIVLKVVLWVAVWAVVFIIGSMCYKITYNVFYDIPVNPDSTTKIEYTVTADATDESVYADLEDLGVMNCSEFIYKLRAIVFDAEYVEGTYYISDGYNIEKIINILAGYSYSDDDDE